MSSPSFAHETPLHLVRGSPDLVRLLLREVIGLPVDASCEVVVDEADLGQLFPTELRADLVLTLRGSWGRMSVLLERQLTWKERKRYVWPLYAAALKMEIYAKQLRVDECFLFDPDNPGVFEGYRRQGRRFRRIEPEPNGDITCLELGLALGVRRGVIQGDARLWLRWLDAEGRPLPTEAEAANARAQAAEARAQAAMDEAAKARAETPSLAARLEALERKLH